MTATFYKQMFWIRKLFPSTRMFPYDHCTRAMSVEEQLQNRGNLDSHHANRDAGFRDLMFCAVEDEGI